MRCEADRCGQIVVLIGDTDNGEHLVAPIFKISDLGLGKATPERDRDLMSPCVHYLDCSFPFALRLPQPPNLSFGESLAGAVGFSVTVQLSWAPTLFYRRLLTCLRCSAGAWNWRQMAKLLYMLPVCEGLTGRTWTRQ